MISVPVAPGELIDKLTILEIKLERISDAEKLKNIHLERNLLTQILTKDVTTSQILSNLSKELKKINETLWVIEDDIRDCERQKDFGNRFVELARAVYFTNDKRCEIKRDINLHLGSQIIEEKSYQAY
ncbi:MAG: hypothetical protein EXS67_01805 [Candidatus Margulisbacteria bacterium]|nr:hypothetical protein [Candidatus Margulisiibacteriota bacterium]